MLCSCCPLYSEFVFTPALPCFIFLQLTEHTGWNLGFGVIMMGPFACNEKEIILNVFNWILLLAQDKKWCAFY
jgi:hypothetical protein